MKIQSIAVLLSFSVITVPLYAEAEKSFPKDRESLSIQNSSRTKQIDLNKADLLTLSGSFKGIGKKRAQAILEYRKAHNGFKSIEEFAEVKGIGQHFVDINREKLKRLYIIR